MKYPCSTMVKFEGKIPSWICLGKRRKTRKGPLGAKEREDVLGVGVE